MIMDVNKLEASRTFYIETIKNGIEYNQKAKKVEKDFVEGVITLQEAIVKLKGA